MAIKMEAAISSETWVHDYTTTRCHNPKDSHFILDLFNEAFKSPDDIVRSVIWEVLYVGEWLTGNDLEQSSRGLVHGTIPASSWRDRWKQRTTWVKIAGLWNLPNIKRVLLPTRWQPPFKEMIYNFLGAMTHNSKFTFYGSSSSINLSCDRSIASSKVLERDCPGKVIMW
jgi:hypothetical protein